MHNSEIKNKPFSNIELSNFCEQLSVIMHSGISVNEGLNIMIEDSDSPEEKELLNRILEDYEITADFSASLASTGLFPTYMVSMIKLGNETGKLDDIMALMARHYQREAALSKALKSAFTYPLIMTGLISIVIIVLLVKVMPVFNQVFIQLGSELTGLSAFLMQLGTSISKFACVIIIVLCIISALGITAAVTKKGRDILIKLGYKFKSIRQFLEDTASCRFASGLAITVGSGLPVERSVELVQDLTDDAHFTEKLGKLNDLVYEGLSFTTALKKADIFTGQYARMANIGEKTGCFDKTLEKIAELYQSNIDDRIDEFMAKLEPTLVILLSAIVGIVLFSVMLPLMGIMSAL